MVKITKMNVIWKFKVIKFININRRIYEFYLIDTLSSMINLNML